MKTVRISNKNVVEEFNLRSAVTSYASTHGTDIENISVPQKDYLAATDVTWSHSQYDTVIATAASNGRIVLYDIRRPDVELSRLHEHSRQVHRLAFSPFGAQLFLSASHDATARLWDLRNLAGEKGIMSMQSIRVFQSRAEAARDVRWSPTDAYQFAMCTDAGIISLWDIRHPGKALNRLNAHEKACYAVDWHPDGKHVVSAGLDRNVKVWEITNERRRQRPLLVIRAHQGVLNARWRPAHCSSDGQSTGEWQCTQLVTTYSQEDPRVHVWDLRRPLVPFLEIDQYFTPPTDMLWHSENLLWTVGNEGMFTQTDVQFVPETARQTSPCPKMWLPNGSLFSFSESTGKRKGSTFEEFVDLPKEKDSSEEKTGMSHSMTDDETISDHFLASLKRKQGRKLWPQDSTPPSRDERASVLNLDQTLEKQDDHQSQQVGMTIDLDMIMLGVSAFRYLAESYVKPMTANERRKSPLEILPRLEQAFNRNATICDEVLLHRLAQSWKILGSVVVEDLRFRAERNREQRLETRASEAPTDTAHDESAQITVAANLGTNIPKPDVRLDELSDGDKTNVRSFNGFTNGREKHRRVLELDSTSNMTTPLAQPVPDTPFSDRTQMTLGHRSSEKPSEPFTALPPSLLNSHWTAAAASNALREDEPTSSSSANSSPLQSQSQLRSKMSSDDHKEFAESSPTVSRQEEKRSTDPDVHQVQNKSNPGPHPSNPTTDMGSAHDEERRVALHEYRVQNRPILSFEPTLNPSQPDLPNSSYRHDSNESFPMFSASTDSSHRVKSVGGSFESAGLALSHDASTSSRSRSSLGSSSGNVKSSPRSHNHEATRLLSHGPDKRAHEYDSDVETQDIDEQTPPTLPFSFEGLEDTRLDQEDHSLETSTRDFGTKSNSLSASLERQSPEHFHKLPSYDPLTQGNVYLRGSLPLRARRGLNGLDEESRTTEIDEYSPGFIHSDFEHLLSPGDSLKNPFPWSPFQLLLSCLKADSQGHNWTIYCQFAAQILFHVLPFYFPKFTDQVASFTPINEPENVVSRPYLESVLSTYLEALQVHSLFVLATEVRTFCKEYGFKNVYATTSNDEEESSWDKGHFVFAACRYCAEPLGGRNSDLQCSVCCNVRDPCPLCLSVSATTTSSDHPKFIAGGNNMWTYCQGCGHGGHVACVTEWLNLLDSQGCCPTLFCGHDCSSGLVRDQRVESLLKAEAEASLVRGIGASSGAKTDSWVVPQSAAVGQTRAVLSARGGSGGIGGGGKKQVRLVTPGEQSGP